MNTLKDIIDLVWSYSTSVARTNHKDNYMNYGAKCSQRHNALNGAKCTTQDYFSFSIVESSDEAAVCELMHGVDCDEVCSSTTSSFIHVSDVAVFSAQTSSCTLREGTAS